MKPREWKIFTEDVEGQIASYVPAYKYADAADDEIIIVREVVPGSITITREELEVLICRYEDGQTARSLLDELFGPLTQDSTVS